MVKIKRIIIKIVRRLRAFRIISKEKSYIRDFKYSLKSCGENLSLYGKVDVVHNSRIVIGNDVCLNEKVYLNGESGIIIGNNVTLSYGVKVISTGYIIEDFIYNHKRNHFNDKTIIIGDNCWIGAASIILPGVHISGKNVIVGAGSVVTKDITESNVVYAGNPAKKIKDI